jgi:O-antigen ligase
MELFEDIIISSDPEVIMAENKNENYMKTTPFNDKNLSRFLQGSFDKKISTPFFFISGIILAILIAFAVSYSPHFSNVYIFAGLLGGILAILVLRRPELGGYLLILSVFTNISNILTDKGLPAVNQPLIALTSFSILANYILRTGKYSKFPPLSRTEWALMAYYAVIIASVFQYSDKAQAYTAIIGVTKDIFVGICLFLLFDTKEKWEMGIWIIIGTISFISLLGVFKMAAGSNFTFFNLAQLSAYGQIDQAGNLRYAGPEGESNIWAQVLTAALPLILYRLVRDSRPMAKVLLGVSAIFTFLAIVYTGSRGAFIAFVVIMPLMIIEMHMNPVQILAGILVFIILLTILPAGYSQRFQTLDLFFAPQSQYSLYQDDSFVSRQEAMLTGLAMFRAYPILGVGFANYGNNYWQFASDLGFGAGATSIDPQNGLPEAHSLYIEVISETGILGILTFFAFFAFLFLGLLRARKKYQTLDKDPDWVSWITSLIMAILAFLVSGIFLHGIQFRYIWMLIGLALAGISISDNAPKLNLNVVRGRSE